VHDDSPLLELHGWELVHEVVDGIEYVAIRCDASGVVEVCEGLLQK